MTSELEVVRNGQTRSIARQTNLIKISINARPARDTTPWHYGKKRANDGEHIALHTLKTLLVAFQRWLVWQPAVRVQSCMPSPPFIYYWSTSTEVGTDFPVHKRCTTWTPATRNVGGFGRFSDLGSFEEGWSRSCAVRIVLHTVTGRRW